MARRVFAAALAAACTAFAQFPQDVPGQPPLAEPSGRDKSEDAKLPNGKSRADAIAADEHKKAIKEADELVQEAEKLRDDIKSAGKFVVPLTAVRRTEEIEKLAKKIRGRLRS